jgi:hypothetical protein
MSLKFQQQPELPTPRKKSGLWKANVRPARKHLTEIFVAHLVEKINRQSGSHRHS